MQPASNPNLPGSSLDLTSSTEVSRLKIAITRATTEFLADSYDSETMRFFPRQQVKKI